MNVKLKQKLQDICDKFNKENPVGARVTLKLDSGELFLTETRSEAQVLSGHTPVIWLKNLAGCYLLDRVTPAAEPAVPRMMKP